MGKKINEIRLYDRLFLIGPPGIGKTEKIKMLAKDEAEKNGRIFVDLREADDKMMENILNEPGRYYVFLRIIAPHVFPEDIAIPRVDIAKNMVNMLPLKYYRILASKGIMGVLFIDELTNVKREDQLSMFFSLILEKELSYNIKLSDDIKIIAAGNTQEWSEIAGSLPKPLRAGRLIIIEVLPPDIDEWRQYMEERFGDAWDKRIYMLLKAYRNLLLVNAESDEEAIACPRSWTMLAKLLYEYGVDEDVVYGIVGRKAGTYVMSILKTEVDIEKLAMEFKRNPQMFKDMDVTKKILLINYLASRGEGIVEYDKALQWMAQYDAEFAIMLIMSIEKGLRMKILTKMPMVFNTLKERIKRVL